jgi:hypothetical protein
MKEINRNCCNKKRFYYYIIDSRSQVFAEGFIACLAHICSLAESIKVDEFI